MIQKMARYLRTRGIRRFVRHLISRAFGVEEMSYRRWRRLHRLTKKEIEGQKMAEFPVMPKFSIVFLPSSGMHTSRERMLASIRSQTYPNWELCVQQSVNEALEQASGDYFVFLDPEGALAPNALFACVRYRNQNGDFELLYSDEDQMSPDGKAYFSPQFKSGFNPDLLRSKDYISHFFVVRRDVREKTGGFEEAYKDAQGYAYVLRCVENCRTIVRLPQMLYHKSVERPLPDSYAGGRAGVCKRAALLAHLERLGLQADVTAGEAPGVNRIRYLLREEPLVSVIIPNKDHGDDLKRCVGSVCRASSYHNMEILIIENNSTRKETFACYKELEETFENVRVLTWSGGKEFNYAALNNFGSRQAAGKYLLFLNNDTELIEADSIREMVSYAQRADVGIAGARLWYPDDSVQHAGVILGLGGVAGHAFKDAKKGDFGYDGRAVCAQDYTAVTAACMLISRQMFETVGGFDEKLKVAFNDVDLCMKVRREGKLVVYTPYAQMYHYESKSRGLDDTEEKQRQYQREVSYFRKKWRKELEEGDPYYNPHLTLEKHDFSLQIC